MSRARSSGGRRRDGERGGDRPSSSTGRRRAPQSHRRRQHESPPRLPSSRVGGGGGGGGRGRQSRGLRADQGNIRGGAAPPLPPPSIPMGCLRSADLIYELLERKTKIGRGNNCDVVLTTSKSISSAHAVVLFNGPFQASLRDLNSTNGTFVNNVRVHNDVYPLESGDILRFGCDVQSYRFELAGDMPEYAPRKKGKKKKTSSSPGDRRAAGASTHHKRRSDSPSTSRSPSRSPSREGRRRQWGDGATGSEARRKDAPHLRTSPGNVGLDEKEDDAPRSPLSPPPVPRSANVGAELGDSLSSQPHSQSQSQSQADLSIKLAHAEGARKGRLEAELEDLKKRLAESDGRSMGIAQYRRERRALLRRERKRVGSGGSDNDENGGPDSDLMVYRTAHGVVRELSPSRKGTRRLKASEEGDAIRGDPFEFAEPREMHPDSNTTSATLANHGADDPRASGAPHTDAEVGSNRQLPSDDEEKQRSREYGDNADDRAAERDLEDEYYDHQHEEPPGTGGGGFDRGQNRATKAQRDKMDYHQQQQRRGTRRSSRQKRKSEAQHFRDSIDEDYEHGAGYGEDGEANENERAQNMRRSKSSPLPKGADRRQRRRRLSKDRREGSHESLVSGGSRQSQRGEEARLNVPGELQPVEIDENEEEQPMDLLKGYDMDAAGDQDTPPDDHGMEDLLRGAAMEGGDESMPVEQVDRSSPHSASVKDKQSAEKRGIPSSTKPAAEQASPDASAGQAQGGQVALIEQLQRELAEVREAGHARETRLREMTERQNKMIIAAEAAATARMISRGNISSSSTTTTTSGDSSRAGTSAQEGAQSSGGGGGIGGRAETLPILPSTSLAQDLVDDAVDSSLSAIKDKLDASLQRRGELRDTMGDLSKAAVEAHIAKLEKAEARHQEELQALRVVAEKARSEATQAREEAKKARADAGGVAAEDGTEVEGDGDAEEGGGALQTSAAPSVPGFTAAQLSAIEEASSREKEYVSQLETARDALNKMREKLSEAQASQNEEADALKNMSRDVERKHREQLDKLRKTHRAQMLRLVAASRKDGDGDENPEALANDVETEGSGAAPKVSAAMVALQAMTADMERHEEASRQQLQIMQERLAETEKVHREQLESMGDRHRRELEAAAVGTTARAMTMAITDSAALSAARKQEQKGEGEDDTAAVDGSETSMQDGDSSSTIERQEEQPMTARRALHDFQHSTNEFAHPPSPVRQAFNESANADGRSNARDNAVDELKALAEAARESHAREMLALREEHRTEIERMQRSAENGTTSSGGEEKMSSSGNPTFLALQQECEALRARIAAYESQESDSANHTAQAQDSARAAVLRPLVRGLHLDGLKRGFTALNSERKRAEEASQIEGLRIGAARTLRCVALRSGRDLLRLGWSKWKSMASGVAHDLRTALAVQTAVSESGDAVRAQGLELYCVELQQRMKEMQEEAAEQEQLMDELHDMDWPRVVLQQKRTIRVLQEQTVSLKQEIEDERAGFARAMNKAMTTLNGDGKKKQGRGRSSGRDSRSKNAHNLQEFITDISRQVSRHREEVLEWQRRHKRSTRAWVELEQERDHLATELDRVHAHGIDQTRGWRDMVSARDRQIVRLEDQLSRLAGGSDDAKLAAAQVLVRKLHEMRREEEERMTARAEEMKKDAGSSIGATNRRANTTHVDVLQSRIVALQNELRQMQEEGGVSSTVAARQAARAAQQEVAAATLHAERLEMSVRQMKKNSP